MREGKFPLCIQKEIMKERKLFFLENDYHNGQDQSVHAVCVTSLGVNENKLIYRQPPGYMGPHLCKFELTCTFWSINA